MNNEDNLKSILLNPILNVEIFQWHDSYNGRKGVLNLFLNQTM